jgi:amidohydrolase
VGRPVCWGSGVYCCDFVSTTHLSTVLAPYADEIIALRRDLHTHPELGHHEVRSSQAVADRLAGAGLSPRLLEGSGVICDVGSAGPLIALRADLDALPLQDLCGHPWASIIDGVSHACGHDVHTAGLVGAGLALADLHRAGQLPGRVRLIFQPAEELMPGGALDVLGIGGLDDVERAYALHCDPHTDVGLIGSRAGPITAASDQITVQLFGHGGHTSRPHLTEDVIYALGLIVTGVPGVLSRRLDPRSGASMVWGAISAGVASNAIPSQGVVRGTFRCLDAGIWAIAGSIIADAVHEIVAPYGVRAEVTHTRGVPPTVNDAAAVQIAENAVRAELGEQSVILTPQSLGGEDFAWMLEKVPGAMVRLGTRTPGGTTHDLHRPDFDVDERAVTLAATVLGSIALCDLSGRIDE